MPGAPPDMYIDFFKTVGTDDCVSNDNKHEAIFVGCQISLSFRIGNAINAYPPKDSLIVTIDTGDGIILDSLKYNVMRRDPYPYVFEQYYIYENPGTYIVTATATKIGDWSVTRTLEMRIIEE